MNPFAGVNTNVPGLIGIAGETPRVLKAIGTQIIDEKLNPVYYIACFIRHWDESRRCAVTKSTQSRAHAAKAMSENLESAGVQWDGSFRWGTPQELGLAPTDVDPEEVKRLIVEN